MRYPLGRFLLLAFCAGGILSSIFWLVGYARAIEPFAADGFRENDFSFLGYPQIKWYTEWDEQTGRMSEMKIDWFSVSDGPTGVIYAHRYVPCWIVSVIALFTLIGAALGIIALNWRSRTNVR